MQKGSYLSKILRSNKTVFSFEDIALIWGDSSSAARARLAYYLRKGELVRIRRGVYGKDKNYDKIELASKIFTPAYVSFETVLGKEGLIFQYYNQIFVASYLSREIVCDGQKYSFHKMKSEILSNPKGITIKNNRSIAEKERAFLDTLYINKEYYFDNLSPLNWQKVFEILPIYGNKRMEREVKKIYKDFKKQK